MKRKLLLVLTLFVLAFTLASAKGNKALWKKLDKVKDKYEWVDLSLDVSPQTPHWHGFKDLKVKAIYTFETTGNTFLTYEYTLPGQYGTHTDFPAHFDPKGRTTDDYGPKELAYKLVVIDKSAEVAKNNDYVLTKQDILDFEKKYGKIPEGAFVAFRSDWSKRDIKTYENKDKKGQSHYPGWDLEALKFLVGERNVAAVGHETADTDSAVTGSTVGFIGEDYVLDSGKLNVELLKNLDKLPPVGGVVFVTFPKIKGGTGFTSRVFAVIPK